MIRMHRRDRSSSESTFPHTHRRRNPSFSSSLLDAIYRSIDESDGQSSFPCHRDSKTTMITKQSSSYAKTSSSSTSVQQRKDKITSLRRAIMLESSHSASSSSDSSCGGVFSSSENELRPRSKKPERFSEDEAKNPKNDGKLSRTKLKALKMYGELKKSKQPISPGSRLSSFLNSIFNSNAKKVQICSVGITEDVTFDERKSKSACSFSRSCLNAKPCGTARAFSTTSKNDDGPKRSVRLYPVSAIVDEDSRPSGQKHVDEDDPRLKANLINETVFKRSSLREELRIEDYVRSYQKSVVDNPVDDDDEDDEDDDGDAWSCSSSDLFELDHHRIGVARCTEELPVYETTNIKTNQAIAKGLVS